MKDWKERIELIQQLSKQEGMTQPSPADWLRDQDAKSRDAKALSHKQAPDAQPPEPCPCLEQAPQM